MSTLFILKLMPTVLRTINHLPFTIHSRAKRGFTLIELLIVIAIIAILVTVIIAAFGGTQDKARDVRRREDLDALKKALELFKSDTTGSSFYPNCDAAATSCSLAAATSFDPDLATTYIRIFPRDPTQPVIPDYVYVPSGCSGVNCTGYTLVACLQNTNAPTVDGVISKGATVVTGSGCPIAVTKVYTVTNP